MTIQIKMSESDSIILKVWTDEYDEKTQRFASKNYHLCVRGKHLSICDNSMEPMKIKTGKYKDMGKPLSPVRMVEKAMKRKSEDVDAIYIKINDKREG